MRGQVAVQRQLYGKNPHLTFVLALCVRSIKGAGAIDFVEHITVADVKGLEDGTGTLSVIPNEAGGILDDTIVTKMGPDHVFMVVNGACKHSDLAHMHAVLADSTFDASIEHHEDRQLIALQGDGAQAALSQLVPASVDLSQLAFMTGLPLQVNGADCHVTRCGYTGEDGFEVRLLCVGLDCSACARAQSVHMGRSSLCFRVGTTVASRTFHFFVCLFFLFVFLFFVLFGQISVAPEDVRSVADALVGLQGVEPAGLGARDSLRLEAGLCLYVVPLRFVCLTALLFFSVCWSCVFLFVFCFIFFCWLLCRLVVWGRMAVCWCAGSGA